MTFLILLFSCMEMKFLPSSSAISHIEPNEVVIKSEVAQNKDHILLDISLPLNGGVGFEIFNTKGMIKHSWRNQVLPKGQHKLSLGLPKLSPGRYWLYVYVDEKIYKHLVILP